MWGMPRSPPTRSMQGAHRCCFSSEAAIPIPRRLEDRYESGARVVDQLQYVEVFDLGRDAINPRHHVDDLLREEGTGFLLVIPQVEVPCLAVIIEREALEAKAGHAFERSSLFA